MKNPGFTAVAVLTLALGIGANTAMFSVLNVLLLRALPYPNSQRLVRVFRTSPQSRTWPHSVANFLDHREQNRVFERMAAFSWWSFNLAEPGAPAERLRGIIATADFFPTLGVAAALGRAFTAEEDQPGGNNVVVLSQSFWMRRFAGDTNIIGRTLRLDGENVTVIGVMPGASLFVRGLQRFTHRDPGWRVDGLLTGWLSLPGTKYARPDQQLTFFQRLGERLAALPGVERAAISSSLPIWGFGSSHTIVVEGRPPLPPGQEPLVYAESVSPDYFETIGIQLRQGRVFAFTDTTNRNDVVVINEAMARHFWPNENPLGKRIASRGSGEPHWQEIVGVVSDVRFPTNLSAPDTRLQVYYPFAQEPRRFAAIELRTTRKPESVASAVRRAVSEIDPDQPVNELDGARKIVDRNLANFGLVGTLLGAFAVLGLVLAAVGTYGVISSFVAQRTGEIGIRMALGAQKRDVLWLVLGRGLRLLLAGSLLGVGGALATARAGGGDAGIASARPQGHCGYDNCASGGCDGCLLAARSTRHESRADGSAQI